MSKVRVYELAKDFGMKGPEMAKLLRQLGFEKIKSHMAVLDAADEMLVVARLEAQGLQRGGGTATAPAKPAKKALPGAADTADEPSRKSLPPPVAGAAKPALKKKKLEPQADAPDEVPTLKRKALPEPAAAPEPEAAPADTSPPPEPAEVAPPAAEAPTPAASPAPEATAPATNRPEPKDADEAAATPSPAAESPAGSPAAGSPAGSPAESPAGGTAPASEPAAKAEPRVDEPTGRDPVEAPPAPDTSEPAAPAASSGDEAPAQPQVDPAPATEAQPAAPPPAAAPAQPAAAEQGAEAAADPAATAPGADVKKLLVPQAKAQVVGRIELPQQVIRDATRRSAPMSDRAAADRNLRRKALQSTQGRHSGRVGGRRPGGPSGGGLRDRNRRDNKRTKGSSTPIPTVDPNKVVEIEPPISIKALSEAVGIKVNQLIGTLTFKLGVKGKTINSFLTPDEVELVALELGRNIKIVEHKEAEEELLEKIVESAAGEESFERAPVVTFMGHVDHGKTTLLDALRNSDVTQGEAGGITQHIGAYKVTNDAGRSIVVLDTPGHAAFTSMRARGANITDIVVLVVAADDGVMPQTEEAINHAKAAGVPIVVAINKCDAPGANAMQVKQQLSIKELQPEEWGGNIGMVEVSALKGEGLDELVERILLEAEINLELTAKPSAAGKAVIVESKQTPEQGVVISALVMDGTIRVRDNVLCGESFARVRGMTNDRGEQVDEAGPSTPVELLGLDKLPMPGDKLYVVADSKKAKEVVEDRQRRARDMSLAERSGAVTLENLSEALSQKKVEELKLIIKADVMGSLEPIKSSLMELNTDEVKINIVHSALGGISETDVSLAEASGAVIIGFNSVADTAARQAAERAGVQIRYYEIIYELLDAMRDALEGLLAPEEVENVIGHAEVRATFKSSKFGTIAGCYVTDGIIKRNARIRLTRDGRVVFRGEVDSLRRIKDDVKEVRSGYECGLTVKNYNDVKEGDILEFFEIDLVKRTL